MSNLDYFILGPLFPVLLITITTSKKTIKTTKMKIIIKTAIKTIIKMTKTKIIIKTIRIGTTTMVSLSVCVK
jgi:hypothetical protein